MSLPIPVTKLACSRLRQPKPASLKFLSRKTYAHDAKGMIAAAPDAGLFYICNPNNPTGTLTPHSDIQYLLENKPKGSVVMVDEAYIHFCDAHLPSSSSKPEKM